MRIITLKIRHPVKEIIFARIFIILMLVASFAFVWHNSAKVAEDSDRDSLNISEKVAPKVVKDYEKLSKEQQTVKINKVNSNIREMAHSIEFISFGIFFLLLNFCVFDFGKSPMLSVFVFSLLVTGLCCFLVALSDEIHQTFTDGRTFQFLDIGMDMLGSLFGFVVTFAVILITARKYI